MSYVHRIRVRYAETDAQQVAHHSAYVVWLEEARIEALRSLGRSYRVLEEEGVLMPVIEVQVRYRRALRFDDEPELVTTVGREGRTRLRFETVITKDDGSIALSMSLSLASGESTVGPLGLTEKESDCAAGASLRP